MKYKVSKDYPRLKQLLDEGHKVVCWVTYDWNRGRGYVATDIAEARQKYGGKDLEYAISVRGCCFFDTHPYWDFEKYTDEGMYKDWEGMNLQFIDPDPSRNTLDLERVN